MITRTVETLDDVAAVLSELLNDELREVVDVLDNKTVLLLYGYTAAACAWREATGTRVKPPTPSWSDVDAKTPTPK